MHQYDSEELTKLSSTSTPLLGLAVAVVCAGAKEERVNESASETLEDGFFTRLGIGRTSVDDGNTKLLLFRAMSRPAATPIFAVSSLRATSMGWPRARRTVSIDRTTQRVWVIDTRMITGSTERCEERENKNGELWKRENGALEISDAVV